MSRFPRLQRTPEPDPRWNGMTREQVAEMLAAIAFPDLVDVDETTPEDGWAPQWDDELGKYVPAPIGGASGVVVNVVYVVDLDGIFDPEAPSTATAALRYAFIEQDTNPTWNGIWAGTSDGVTPAPMEKVADLPAVDGYIASLYLATQVSEVGAPLSGGFVLARSAQTAETLAGSGWYIAARGAAGGAVDSVNAQTGAVVLDAEDVGADPAGTAASAVLGLQPTDEKDQPGGYAGLDGDGLIATSALPALAIGETFTVASQAAMLALTAQRGDIAIRSDTDRVYRLVGPNPALLTDWVLLPVPADAVQSINGQTGIVVLVAADVGAAPVGRSVTAGTGLTGGGDLSADRSLAVDFGTGAGEVTQGNDARVAAVPSTAFRYIWNGTTYVAANGGAPVAGQPREFYEAGSGHDPTSYGFTLTALLDEWIEAGA